MSARARFADIRSDRRSGAVLLVLAIVLTGLNLRTAISTVGSLLENVQRGLGMSSGMAGLLTTLPVICFAVLGAATPRLSRWLGEHGALAVALTAMTVGLLTRAFAGAAWVFLTLSVLALAGGAIGNVALPAVVKRHFPERTGRMVAAYSTALAIGQAAGAALAVPIARLGGVDGWRFGVGAWAALSGIAVVPWLPLFTRGPRGVWRPHPARGAGLAHSPTAWALTVFFGTQSAQAYIAFGWFAQFFRDAGTSAQRAGLLVAVISVLAVPMSLVVPSLAVRMSSQRPLVAALAGCMLGGYVGMLVAPTAGAWLWMLLAGVGLGLFPLALTMIALRTRAPSTTASLSAFSQGGGYLIAASGPLLVGVLRGATGGWVWPFGLMFVLLAAMTGAGWFAARDRYVDDDVGTAQSGGRS